MPKLDRTIIFCPSYDSCTHIYYFFSSNLEGDISEPKGFPNHPELRIVDMFTSCTHAAVKKVLAQFTRQDSCLRVIIATVAFGMGLDCPNVHRIIHWGPTDNIEAYMQETGRAGRDDRAAVAVLYGTVRVSSSHIHEGLRDYIKLQATDCRRKHLLQPFDQEVAGSVDICGCHCCDLSSLTCLSFMFFIIMYM